MFCLVIPSVLRSVRFLCALFCRDHPLLVLRRWWIYPVDQISIQSDGFGLLTLGPFLSTSSSTICPSKFLNLVQESNKYKAKKTGEIIEQV